MPKAQAFPVRPAAVLVPPGATGCILIWVASARPRHRNPMTRKIKRCTPVFESAFVPAPGWKAQRMPPGDRAGTDDSPAHRNLECYRFALAPFGSVTTRNAWKLRSIGSGQAGKGHRKLPPHRPVSDSRTYPGCAFQQDNHQ